MALNCPPNCLKGTPLWNLYDVTDNNPEFCLFESLVGEYTDIAGFEVLYYRAKSKLDRLYGEDSNQDYYQPVKTKLYYEPTEEPNVIDAFGIRSDETLEYSLIPKIIFNRDVGGTIEGVPETISNAFGGSGYRSSKKVDTSGGTGTGLCVDIHAVDGRVDNIKINTFNRGQDYTIGDVIRIEDGDMNAVFQIASVTTSEIQPMAGDVIKTLWNNRNYEIVDIGAEQAIFMGRKLVWEFILRPYRFSEQSLIAEEIHRSEVVYNQIHIHPDGEFVDIIFPNGSEMTDVPINTLDIDISMLECGSTYKQNTDGSFDLLLPDLAVEPDYDPHPTYHETDKPEENKLVESYGDNSWIEVESNKIDNYDDLDDIMFSYTKTFPINYGVSTLPTINQIDIDGFEMIDATDGESYKINYTTNNEFVYTAIPINLNEYDFLLNGLTVVLEETTQDFVLDGTLYTTLVFKSQYRINGEVILDLIPKNRRL
jgi:hypothetical protein